MAAAASTNNDENKEEDIDTKCNSALILVDIQKEYYSDDKGVNESFPNFPEQIKSLLLSARQLSKENKLQIIHTREIDNKQSLWMSFWDKMNPDEPAIAAKGIAEDFCKVLDDEKLIIKRTFDAFLNTELDEYLKTNKITKLYFCGLVTKMCVLHSVLSAFARGYQTYIISDCCGDSSVQHHNQILAILNGNMAKVIKLKEFVDSN